MSGAAAGLDDNDGEAVKLPKPRLSKLHVPKLRIPFAGARRSWWFNGALVVTLLGLVGGGYAITNAKSASVTSSETVSTAKTGIVLSSVSATGNVESPDDLGVNFQQSGRVVSIAVQPGQHVEAGDELARIEDATQQSSLASAQAQLASARAQLSAKRKGQTDAEKVQDAAGLAQAQLSIDSADKALARAKASADLNATKYQLLVEQAAAQVDSATASAAGNSDKYNLAVEQAAEQIDAVEATAAENEDKYDLAVEQAEDQYDEAQSDLSNASTQLSSAQSSLQSLQSSYDPSASSGESASAMVSRYQADQSSCQANASDPSYTLSDGVDCDHVADLLQAAQTYSSAQSSYEQARNAASSTSRAVDSAKQSRASGELQDQQQIASANRSLETAKQNRTSGLLQDQQQIESAKRALDTAKLNQSSGLLQDQQQIETSEGSLNSARASYASTVASNQVKAEGTPEEIAQAEASVASAQNQVDSAQRNVEDTILRAPIAGTVGSVSGQVGEYTGSGGGSSSSSASSSSASSSSSSSSSSTTSGFVVLTNLDLLDVKVGFTETDAAKVKVGQDATVTIDAIGGDTLEGTVVSLDVNQTVVNNVVTYYAQVAFDDEPASVKPGMTASVSVVLDKREDVVTLPTAAVSTMGTTATITVRANGGTESQRTIGIGLRGDNAVEITSGLEDGETVVTRTTTTGGGGNNFRPPGGGGIGGGIGGGGRP